MPAAIPVVLQLGAAALAGAVGIGGVAASLVVAGAGVLGSYMSSQFFSEGATQSTDRNGLKTNTSTTERALPVLYGNHRVGGNDVFIETKDDYLWIVQCICEGPIEGFKKIPFIKPSPTGATDYAAIYIDGEPIIKYDKSYKFNEESLDIGWTKRIRKVIFSIHEGTNSQLVDSTFNNVFPQFTDPMRNTTYIVYGFLKKYITSVPNREVVIKGRTIYDLISSQTIFSRNPVNILYDYITNSNYGLGWKNTDLELISWTAAAAYCNEPVPGKRPVRFAMDYAIARGLKSQTVIDTILSHFRGALTWWDGKLHLRYLDSRATTLSPPITDADIARASTGEDLISVSQPSIHAVPDGVVSRFTSYLEEDDNWYLDDVKIGDSSGQVSIVDFPGYSDRDMAYEMGLYTLKRQQANRSVAVTLRPSAIQYDVNDLVKVTSSEIGLIDSIHRVVQNDITPDGLSTVSLLPDGDYLYSEEIAPQAVVPYVPKAGSPLDEPPPVINVVVNEEKYEYRERTFIRLNITFDVPVGYSYFDHVEVRSANHREDSEEEQDVKDSDGTISSYDSVNYEDYYVLSSTTDWDDILIGSFLTIGDEIRGVVQRHDATGGLPNLLVLSSSFGNLTDAEFKYIPFGSMRRISQTSTVVRIDPVEEGSTYYIALKSVSTAGVRQDEGNDYVVSHKVIGISLENPTSTIAISKSVSENTLQINCKKISPLDVLGYEVRMYGWTHGVYLTTVIEPPILFGGVKPGPHTIAVNTIGTNKLYGEVATSTSFIVPSPPAFHSVFYESGNLDLSLGSHNNTEMSGAGIKCSHTGGNLTGEYTSVYKHLAGKRDEGDGTLTYVYFTYAVMGTPKPDASAEISIAIQTSTGLPWSTHLTYSQAEFLMGAFTDSYVRVVITITDSSENSNIVVGNVEIKSAHRILRWESLVR